MTVAGRTHIKRNSSSSGIYRVESMLLSKQFHVQDRKSHITHHAGEMKSIKLHTMEHNGAHQHSYEVV